MTGLMSESSEMNSVTVCGLDDEEKATALIESLPGIPVAGISVVAGRDETVLCSLPFTHTCTESVLLLAAASATEKMIVSEQLNVELSAGESTSMSLLAGSASLSFAGLSGTDAAFFLSEEPEQEMADINNMNMSRLKTGTLII